MLPSVLGAESEGKYPSVRIDPALSMLVLVLGLFCPVLPIEVLSFGILGAYVNVLLRIVQSNQSHVWIL